MLKKETHIQDKGLRTLSFQLTVVFTAVILVIVLASLSISLYLNYKNDIESFKTNNKLVTNLQASSLKIPMWNMASDQIDALVRMLADEKEIVSAKVYDGQNKLLSQYNRTEAAQQTHTFSKDIIYELNDSTQKIGRLELVFTTDFLVATLTEEGVFNAGIFLILLLLSLVVTRAVTRHFILNPINLIAETMRHVSKGDLNQEVPEQKNVEFNQMARRFNTMTSNLRSIYKTIETELETKEGKLTQSTANVKKAQSLAAQAVEQLKIEKQRSERLLIDATNISPVAQLILNERNEVVLWNDKFTHLNTDHLSALLKQGIGLEETLKALLPSTLKGPNLLDKHLNYKGPFEAQLGDGRWFKISKHLTKDSLTVLMYIEISDLKKREEELTNLNEDLEAQAEELKTSQTKYILATEGSNDGLWDWNIKTDQVFYSGRWKEMLGYEESAPITQITDWLDRIHPQEKNLIKKEMNDHLEGKTERFECEYQIRHQDGSYLWVQCRGIAARDEDGKPIRMAGSQADITMRKNYEDQLIHSAYHDALTGLPNRTLFLSHLQKATANIDAKNQKYCAVLFLDLDRFKVINDSLGHSIGDELLMAVSKRLEKSTRPGDYVARLGGDEFTVLLTNISSEKDAENAAARLSTLFQKAFHVDNREIYVSASIGISMLVSPDQEPDSLLRNADLAMYRAKDMGRARAEVYDDTLHSKVMTELQVGTDLRKALEKDEIFVAYQPLVRLSDGAISSFEALARWRHSERGLVPQDLFISIAEDTGQIIPIGDYILNTACSQLKTWHDMSEETKNISMAINISAKQIADLDQARDLIQTIKNIDLPKDKIKLEITESVIMQNPDNASKILNEIKDLGVKLCIDDFGTGYSSFSYLYQFPFDVLKIDRAFVCQMTTSDKHYRLVRGINDLAHDLGLEVVAEGVETVEELKLLCQIGCDYIQGYYFSRPMYEDQATRLLQEKMHFDNIPGLYDKKKKSA